MNCKKLVTVAVTMLSIASVILMVSCSKSDPAPAATNPVVIPVQTVVQPTVAMGTTSTIAVLAGSSITNTGATNITGDMELSPGSSIGGFPPGILTGVQHI